MKAIVEFDLPEEQESYDMFMKGPRAYLVLAEMAEWFRSRLKYHDGTSSEEALSYIGGIAKARNEFADLIEAADLDIFVWQNDRE